MAKSKEMVGDSSGIYALYKGKKLYYFGLAKNFLRRIKFHMKGYHKNHWDKLVFCGAQFLVVK